jgi:hypothetical protein
MLFSINVVRRNLTRYLLLDLDRFWQDLKKKKKLLNKIIFCSTLSEFENFLLCERILINVTTCQNETSS